ncbi:hypothetical protein B0H14DRAFT_2601639 [Mycena olivaceomarginata]|nr:hypothetical protein B0H14DRAFT_2601639 [Mycena olivaceomarginata]
MEGDTGRVAGPLAERKRRGGRESGGWKRNDTRGDESVASVAAGDDGRHNGGQEPINVEPSIRKTDLFASTIGIRITIEAAAGFGGSVRVGLTRRRFGFGRKGVGRRIAGGPGGERSVEPACEGEPLIVAAIDKSDALAARRANYPRETCSECPTGCAGPAGPLLESDRDGGVDAEKCRPNFVRGRAVAYADGGEGDTTKSYDADEAVVWCPDWSILEYSTVLAQQPRKRVALRRPDAEAGVKGGGAVAVSRDWRKRGSLDDVGSVRLEGDVGQGTFRVPVAAADIVGDTQSAALWQVETARGSAVPADAARVFGPVI